MIPRARCLAALAAVLGSASPLPAGGAEPLVRLVHIEANVGGASGGHSALRVGSAVHHFQASDDDLLVLERDDWGDFQFRYNVLENRPLRAASIPASADEARALTDGFARVRFAQGRLFAARDRAERDVALLQALAEDRPTVHLRGAGLLDPERAGSSAGRVLRDEVLRMLPEGFVRAQADRLDARLGDPELARSDPRGCREALAARAALAAFVGAHAPGPGVLVTRPAAAPLVPAERRALEQHRRALAEAVAGLLRSPRPDRGLALFVALARSHAVALSLADDRFWTVDPFPDDGPQLDTRQVRKRREELAVVAEILAGRADTARAAFAARPSARRYARLEQLAAKAREYAGGARGIPVRESTRSPVPSRGRRLVVPVAGMPRATLAQPLARARQRSREAHQQLRASWAYGLFTANCVTELARIWEVAVPRSGIRIDTRGLGFVPFVFFERLASKLPTERIERTDSFRRRSLETIAAQPGPLPRTLRESNVWTSRLYEPRDVDGSFLLFSDGHPAVRPLAGVVNLGYATLDGVLGILTAPFDRGDRLVRASKGIFFSLPELAFVNIRKGSFDAAGLRRARSTLADH